MGLDGIGLDLQGRLEMSDGFHHPPQPEQRAAKVAVDVRGLGLDGQRPLEVAHGLVHPSLLQQQVAEIVVGETGAGIPRQGRRPERLQVPVGTGLPPRQHPQPQQQRPADQPLDVWING